ncbi:hypothetical protein I6J42_14075 [Streptomyces californicus]|uniref:Helix-turn-helix domain-containing protein n=1 Tax=Streptomyces californicus TaxID=67351 RepID=A0ABD7CUX0_9ACTN|nr:MULTISPECIES: hypothetical protein [Streptomyces]QRV29330.1 hypothetical protein I6J39_20020 [Streptomyces californicus]QRV35064.1 hypothetical protein I6J42_14075 [Streptomyces californicus]QRV42743.1 hypothetical protein I6J41_19935 [Streptomyces californicus]QRV49430.1 hypothetical protein I6J43_19570 [Streptomyces californicus]
MLSHVIPPVRGYTKCSNSLVRHPRLCSDAKILVLYVQGLPACDRDKALSEHARSLLMTGRAYQRAKAELLAHGYVHERRERIAGGRWRTVQVMSNEPLTADQAARLYAGAPADGYAVVGAGRVGRTGHAGQVGHAGHAGRTASGAWSAPSARFPTVGEPTGRSVGGQLPADEDLGEDTSHPPTEAGAAEEAEGEGDAAASESVPGSASVPVPVPGLGSAQDSAAALGSAAAAPSGSAEVLAAERVLLSLRHERRELLLGVREARTLAGLAAEWLRRGVSPGDLRAALTRGLPKDGVRSALGFLAHRLVEKLPAPPAEQPEPVPPSPPSSPLALIACAGPGEEHMFRPNVPWATTCGPCHREEQRAYWEDMRARTEAAPAPEPLPWRERFAAEGAQAGAGPGPDVGG